MHTPSWMLVRLALETRQHHSTADDERLSLLEAASPEAYAAYLRTIYGFEARYEESLAAAPGLEAYFVRSRLKSDRLRADLIALGDLDYQVDAIDRCAAIPTFRTPAQALGWMYVVERNTLLHGLIRRHLATRIPDEIRRAGTYLASYGDTPGALHRELGLTLDSHAKASSLPIQIVSAATEAFRCQRQWFVGVVRRDRSQPAPLVAS